jgi:hypothetical protein
MKKAKSDLLSPNAITENQETTDPKEIGKKRLVNKPSQHISILKDKEIQVMKKTNPSLILITAMFCLLGITSSVMAKGVTASAQLDRSTVEVGRPAILNITIKGDSQARVSLPDIDGLYMENRGRSSNISIINGRMSSSLTLRYIVIPDKEGDFTISPISVESKGQKITIPQKPKLKAVKGNTPVPKKVAPQGSQQPNIAPQLDPKDIAHLEIVGLKDHAVVGELIPVEIRAYFKNNAQVSLADIQSNPTLDGSSFTVKLDDKKPRQGRTTVNGESYYVIIFNAAISPIKPGEYELPFTMDATVNVRDQRTRRTHRRPSGLNDPFFDDVFDSFFARARSVRKEIHLKSTPFKIKVTPPPTKDKPSNYNGAVGQFTLSATAPTSPIHAGDPITLTVRVSGKGNLSRLKMPPMVDDSGWKTYPAKHHLENADTLESSGTLVFEQTIVPRNPSVKEIPALELAFFNPKTEKYETSRTLPIPIKVLPGTNITEKKSSDASTAQTSDKNSDARPPKELVPYSYAGWLRKSRILDSPAFLTIIAGLTLSLLALAGGLAWNRKRNTPERKEASEKQRNIQSELAQMNDAIQRNDVSAFFTHAKRVTQLYWSQKLGIKPEAVTTTDIPDADARAIVEKADSLAFSGENTDALDLSDWKRRVEKSILTLLIVLGACFLGAPSISASPESSAPTFKEANNTLAGGDVQSAKAAITEYFQIADQSGTSIPLAVNIATAAKQANESGVAEWANATLQLRASEWALIGAGVTGVIWAALIALGVWRHWKPKTHLLITLIATIPIAGGIYSYQKWTPPAHDAVILYPSTAPDGKLLTTTNILVSPFDTAEITGTLNPGDHVLLDTTDTTPETNGYLHIHNPATQTTGWVEKNKLREVGK